MTDRQAELLLVALVSAVVSFLINLWLSVGPLVSMFSQHFLIRNSGGYWNGDAPHLSYAWGGYESAIRLHTRQSAEQLVKGVLAGIACTIVEDE